MKALVINLARETRRMEFQRIQLDRLGIPFERLEARTPDTLAPPSDDPWWQGWERPLTDVEKAVLMSHRGAWDRVVQADEAMLILEDDAMLSERVPNFLRHIRGMHGIDHVTLETRGRRKLLGRGAFRGMASVRRLYQDRSGAGAYVLWPGGARKLLARSDIAPAIADGVICAAYEMVSLQAVPALAIQVDQCGHYGVTSPLTTTSSISPTGPTAHVKTVAQKWRRASAQLRMGLRRLNHPFAARVEVKPTGPWPPIRLDG